MMSPKRYQKYLRVYGERLERARDSRSPLLPSEVQRKWRSYGTKPLTERRDRRRNEVGWQALEWESKA